MANCLKLTLATSILKMTLRQIFIQNLKDFRKKEGISQMKLAEYCNTSASYIGEIEIGRKFPSTEKKKKIAYVLRIDPSRLFINPKENNVHDNKMLPRLPYTIKKQIQTHIKRQIKAQIKTQIRTQINTQVNLAVDEILNEINEIMDKY
jgi:transcriptional regulator with XRE-family HTH domain